MAANSLNLAGRIPRVTSAMSGRLIYFVVGLGVLLVVLVVYGFRYRIERKQALKASATAQVTASDAATSNRLALHAELPGVTPAAQLSGTPAPTPTPAPPVNTNGFAPWAGAVRNVAQPFGPGNAQQSGPSGPIQPAPIDPIQQQPAVDPVAKRKADREERAYERRLAAIDAPTGASQASSNTAAPPSADPLQAAMASLKGLNANAVAPPPASASNAPAPFRSEGDDDPNGQADKLAFQKTTEGDYLKTTRTAPISPWVVERGEVIPAGLPSQIVSDLPGDLIAEVKRDVYDTPQHKYVMIPAGSLLAGEYNSGVTYGQKRVQVIWTYLRFPDGSYVDLDKFVGHSADGSTGLGDQVDNHIKRLIGGIAMSSLFAAGIQISQNHTNSGGSTLSYPSNTQIAASAAGQQAGQVGEQLTARNLQVQPTIKIRPGDVFYVSVMKSIIFPGPYKSLIQAGRK